VKNHVLMILFKKFCCWLCVIVVVLQVCLIGEFCDCVVLFVRSCPSLVLIVLCFDGVGYGFDCVVPYKNCVMRFLAFSLYVSSGSFFRFEFAAASPFLAVQTGCIYKRGILATKGVNVHDSWFGQKK